MSNNSISNSVYRNSLTITPAETSSAILLWDKDKLKQQSKLGNWVGALQDTMPLDKNNRPLGYVDPERVLATGMLGDVQSFLNAPPEDVVVPISYLEGFATIGGIPFWERLDGEPIPYYDVFKMYRDEVLLEPIKDNGGLAKGGMRALHTLSSRSNLDLKTLNAMRETYSWSLRAKAFDDYREKQRSILKEREVRTMENKHAKAARQVFDTCLGYINDHAEELSPKTALSWFEAAVKLERLSYGLLPDKPGSVVAGASAQPLVQLNNVIQNVSPDNTGTGGVSAGAESKTLEILSILEKAGALRTDPQTIDVDPADIHDVTEETAESIENAANAEKTTEVHENPIINVIPQ